MLRSNINPLKPLHKYESGLNGWHSQVAILKKGSAQLSSPQNDIPVVDLQPSGFSSTPSDSLNVKLRDEFQLNPGRNY